MLLVGAGGHAKAIVEIARAAGRNVEAYVDRRQAAWLTAKQITGDDDAREANAIVMGLGGTTPAALKKRLELFDRYVARGFVAESIHHSSSTISKGAMLEAGTIILAGAIIQPEARLGRGVIVNTGAVIEHDSRVGAGCHVAPGALVLGDCQIGECCMIGAASVILPAAVVPNGTLVPALSRYPNL